MQTISAPIVHRAGRMAGVGVAGVGYAKTMITVADDVDHEAVHCQEMGNPAPHVAEFTRCQDIDHGGLDRDGHHLSAADLLLRFILGIPPIVEEVFGALLVQDVEQRATRDQKYHDDDVRLHDRG